MRLISREIDAVLQKPVPVNFGLYFNKFLEYHNDFHYVVQPKNKPPQEKSSFKPLNGEKSGREPKNSPLMQFKKLYCRSRDQVNSGLRNRHLQQSNFCQAAKTEGYALFIFHVRLRTPYISGLGMSHPTETGMVFDHTLGVPYIPAAGQKGLLRLAYMLNQLKDDDGNWLPLDQFSQDKDGNPCWEEDALSRTLFGFSDKKEALAGRLVLLDAYPLSQPELGEDIINPHYGDYYNSQGKKRGPTEDQNPVPVKFLVLKKGPEFVFRFLLRHSLQKAPSTDLKVLSNKISTAMKTALIEEGFGAKTGLGYGRFEILGEGEEPEVVRQWSDKARESRKKWEEDRRARIERERYPWRELSQKIEKINNWGDFNAQVLENSEAEHYRKEREFAVAVSKTALRIARGNPKKWKEKSDREKKVADWLTSSPIIWESPFHNTKPQTIPEKSPPSDILPVIDTLSDWAAYLQSGIKISKLDKVCCAEALKNKFSQWGCKKSKDKQQKKAFDQLVKRLKKLKTGET